MAWESYTQMKDELAYTDAKAVYLESLLEDYSMFTEFTKVPISLNSFVSVYWTILDQKRFEELQPGDIVYVFHYYELEKMTVYESPYYDEEEGLSFVVLEDSRTDINRWPEGTVYSEDIPYRFYSKIRKDENNQWKKKTVLITKTSQAPS